MCFPCILIFASQRKEKRKEKKSVETKEKKERKRSNREAVNKVFGMGLMQ